MSICAESESLEHDNTDQVIVIGGGPAGCAASHAVAQAGLRVVLLERGGPNRDKSCGDMFLPSAVKMLNRLGLTHQALFAASGAEIHAIDLLGRCGRLWKVQYPDEPVWMLPRRLVDQALRDALPPGVRVLYNASATEIVSPTEGVLHVNVRLTTTQAILVCRAVVFACGAGNALSPRFGISGSPIIAPAISAYVNNPGLEAPAFEFSNNCRPGYRWLFPMQNNLANVGVCFLARTHGSTVKASGSALLCDHSLASQVNWRGGVGALWSGLGDRWHQPTGMVSCGDAAGLVNPANGEGLTAALTSGSAAGTAIANFMLHNRDTSWLRNYSNWVKTSFSTAYAPSPLRAAWKQLCGLNTA